MSDLTQGEVLINVLAAFACFEGALIGARTREALAAKRAQGVKLGRPRLIPEAVVQRIVTERAQDRTLRAIAAGLNRDGVRTVQGGRQWWPETVAGVLRSRA